MIWITFVVLAALFNAVMDTIRFEYRSSIFSLITNSRLVKWVNPSISQPNKWKDSIMGSKPRFFGSTTFLVWTTDLWHFCKAGMICFLGYAIVFYSPIIDKFWDSAIATATFGTAFEIANRIMLIKHK